MQSNRGARRNLWKDLTPCKDALMGAAHLAASFFSNHLYPPIAPHVQSVAAYCNHLKSYAAKPLTSFLTEFEHSLGKDSREIGKPFLSIKERLLLDCYTLFRRAVTTRTFSSNRAALLEAIKTDPACVLAASPDLVQEESFWSQAFDANRQVLNYLFYLEYRCSRPLATGVAGSASTFPSEGLRKKILIQQPEFAFKIDTIFGLTSLEICLEVLNENPDAFSSICETIYAHLRDPLLKVVPEKSKRAFYNQAASYPKALQLMQERGFGPSVLKRDFNFENRAWLLEVLKHDHERIACINFEAQDSPDYREAVEAFIVELVEKSEEAFAYILNAIDLRGREELVKKCVLAQPSGLMEAISAYCGYESWRAMFGDDLLAHILADNPRAYEFYVLAERTNACDPSLLIKVVQINPAAFQRLDLPSDREAAKNFLLDCLLVDSGIRFYPFSYWDGAEKVEIENWSQFFSYEDCREVLKTTAALWPALSSLYPQRKKELFFEASADNADLLDYRDSL